VEGGHGGEPYLASLVPLSLSGFVHMNVKLSENFESSTLRAWALCTKVSAK
jgi:hypothetical protein